MYRYQNQSIVVNATTLTYIVLKVPLCHWFPLGLYGIKGFDVNN